MNGASVVESRTSSSDLITTIVVCIIAGGAHGILGEVMAAIQPHTHGTPRKPPPAKHIIEAAGAVTGAFYRWQAQEEIACIKPVRVSFGRRR